MARRRNMQRRREILRNTFILIRENGLENVSLQMIAEKSGISKSLLQSYYPHKSRLITDIIRNMFNTLWAQVDGYYYSDNQTVFARMNGLLYTIGALGIYNEGLNRVIEDAFMDQHTLDKWAAMLYKWVRERHIFSDNDLVNNGKSIRIGLAFIIVGVGRLYRERQTHGLDAQEISDYGVRSFMYTFMDKNTDEINAALADGHKIIEKIDIPAIYQSMNTMFEDGKELYA